MAQALLTLLIMKIKLWIVVLNAAQEVLNLNSGKDKSNCESLPWMHLNPFRGALEAIGWWGGIGALEAFEAIEWGIVCIQRLPRRTLTVPTRFQEVFSSSTNSLYTTYPCIWDLNCVEVLFENNIGGWGKSTPPHSQWMYQKVLRRKG